jgi:phosphoglycerate dehydrogenase-like enzyme
VARQISDADMVVGNYTFGIRIDASLCDEDEEGETYPTAEHRLRPHRCGDLRGESIPVANIGGANAVSVAEHTVMLALILLKRAVYAHSKLVGGQWTQEGL